MLSTAGTSLPLTDNEIENLAFQGYFEEASEICLAVCDPVSKANYVGLAINQLLAPEILLLLQNAFGINMAVSQPAAMPMVCNMIAGSLQIISGVFQMKMVQQGKIYNPVETGIKGVVNMGSGTQLIALTALAPLTLGPIALAVASGVTAGILWDDFLHSVRKMKDEEFWFEDSLARLAFIRKNLTQEQIARQKRIEIKKDIDEANSSLSESDHPVFSSKTVDALTDFIFYVSANRVEDNNKYAEKLENEIFVRLLVDYKNHGDKSYLMRKINFLKEHFDIFSPQQGDCLRGIKNTYDHATHKGDHQVNRTIQINREYCKAFDANPSKVTFDNFQKAANQSKKAAWLDDARPRLCDAIMMTMAFVGFLCLVIPGAQIFSPIFLVSSSAYFISMKLWPASKSIWNSIDQFLTYKREGANQFERYITCAGLFPTPSKKLMLADSEEEESKLVVEGKKSGSH